MGSRVLAGIGRSLPRRGSAVPKRRSRCLLGWRSRRPPSGLQIFEQLRPNKDKRQQARTAFRPNYQLLPRRDLETAHALVVETPMPPGRMAKTLFIVAA